MSAERGEQLWLIMQMHPPLFLRSARLRRGLPVGWAPLLRALLALLLGALGGVSSPGAQSLPAAAPPATRAAATVLQIEGPIGPATADYVVRGIGKAQQSGAPLVVVTMDTPGGLDLSMRQIIQAILSSRVPVAVYVSPQGARAASAGTYILYAAHIAAMAPTATLGAATPVAIGMPGAAPQRQPDKRAPEGDTVEGKGDEGARNPKSGKSDKAESDRSPMPSDALTAKQVNDAAAFIRSLAQQRGRNAEWAERAVREAVSLTASEALKLNVIDLMANDLPDLLAKMDGRTVSINDTPMRLATRGLSVEMSPPDWRQRVLAVITNPSLAMVLLMIGFYGLVLEFSSPGFGVPGVAGAICLLLALFALQLLPINYAGLGLILLGMALMAAELLAPSFGVLGAGGLVAFVVGGLLLFDREVPGFQVPVALIVGLAAATAAVIVLGGTLAMRGRHRPVVSGREEMIGAPGQVMVIDEVGEAWALVHGERWKVRASKAGEQGLRPGQRVRVKAIDGLVLSVDTVPDSDPLAHQLQASPLSTKGPSP